MEMGDLTVLKELGRGFHGVVSLVRHKQSHLLMARKVRRAQACGGFFFSPQPLSPTGGGALH